MQTQDGMFAPDMTIPQRFAAWKATPGGAEAMRIAYAKTAPYADRFIRTGHRVSIKLIWELMRDEMSFIRARKTACPTIESGFALNNDFTAPLARHIMSNKPDWSGMFELREH